MLKIYKVNLINLRNKTTDITVSTMAQNLTKKFLIGPLVLCVKK